MLVLFDKERQSVSATPLWAMRSEQLVKQGCSTLLNGELLTAAEQAGFDVLLTTDKNLIHQQNLSGRKIAIVVLGP
jgi:hypothetical protein